MNANLLTVFPARRIITMDAANPSANAVAVREGRIIAVGSLNEVIATIADE